MLLSCVDSFLIAVVVLCLGFDVCCPVLLDRRCVSLFVVFC